ncbi:MAG: prepilin-type N-terminal cleavage/methylation domain-containing protein [Deltaproteobacteria bacterium]|jgi:prepilin-type N-terminal cleavage/methylation domain-containing protein|nr:prepilin-type N-terminal cleavage/methylation domain-containing protein [Deltaproteobacteria bacterium]
MKTIVKTSFASTDSHLRLSRRDRGFSLFELLTVIAVIALLTALCLPSFKTLIPSSRVNADAQKLASMMRQARTKAANAQKPVRLSINCVDHFNLSEKKACQARLDIAVFTEGVLSSWNRLPGPPINLYERVSVKAVDGSDNPIVGSRLNDDLVWFVFTPSSRVFTSFGPPVNLAIFYGEKSDASILLTLNAASGRVTLTKRT